jgi:hypothetical protein
VPPSPPPATTRPAPAVRPASPAESDPDSDRPTVVPEFDPAAFARDSELKMRSAPPSGGQSTLGDAQRLFEAGDAEQALFLLARLLQHSPFHTEASALSQECRQVLERECLSAIGSPSAVLIIAVRPHELTQFALDAASGFLLSLMDGATNVETVLDLCGLPRLLALRHLRGLVSRGIVRIANAPK